MSGPDAAHLRTLVHIVRDIAESPGPISARLGCQVLSDLAVILSQRGSMPMKVLDHVIGLIEALKEDITA